MTIKFRVAAAVALAVLTAPAAGAGGIDPGLWQITSHSESAGVIGPPQQSTKCLTAEQTGDLATTFSPVPTMINSTCAPIERSLNGPLLTWHLVCKGQIDIELDGSFNFDTPRHYSGTVHSKAEMAGMPMVDSQNMVEGQWVSACPQ